MVTMSMINEMDRHWMLFPKSDGLHVPDIVWASNGMMAFPKME
jgi:hypothetical protein